WSYEVADTKLSREAKAGALLQVLLYADMLASLQGAEPEQVHLVLGGPEPRPAAFRVRHYAAYFRSVRERFVAFASSTRDLPRAVDPVPHCDLCDWQTVCEAERREVDHLSFVAGISRQQRTSLAAAGIPTLEALASLDAERLPRVDGMKPGPFARIHRQALIQLEGRRRGTPVHELLEPVVANQGLAGLPAPSAGDLFFDLEGDPWFENAGIEYLFGVADATGAYTGRWSLGSPEERATFEWFIDMVVARRREFPDLHVYHFAPYEPTALKRLAGRYDTRIDALDDLLRGQVFVDLYRVVRQGLRASVESYSIKKLERFYGFVRGQDLREANRALANFEAWLQLGGATDGAAALLGAIEGYNRDDCLSTLALRDWLETLRGELARQAGAPVPRPGAPEGEIPKEQAERLGVVRELMARLLDGMPEDVDVWSPEARGRWLLAQQLEYHRRENKSAWWRYFDWLTQSTDQLIEDPAALGGLEYEGVVATVKRSLVHRYRFPPQEHRLDVGAEARDTATGKSPGEIVAIDEVARTIDLKRGRASDVPHPVSLIPFELVPDEVLRESLQRIARAALATGLSTSGPAEATIDLLLARPPRIAGGGSTLLEPGESQLDAAIRLGRSLDRSILPIQGPPGTGKTYTGARMILALLEQGKRVGVTATSHTVIGNLLAEVCKAAREAGRPVRGIQKAGPEQWCRYDEIEATGNNAAVLDALTSGTARLAAGTAWLWSREEMAGAVDVLFIDEAGQFSLANALAVTPAAGSVVLLGDPRQLQQPQQGLHPPGADLSALDHLLQGRETLAADRGLFLDETWRLHPAICAFTSEVYYEGRLHARAGLERQGLAAGGPLPSAGLFRIPCRHAGNDSESPEEVGAVRRLVERVLAAGLTWTDRDGAVHPVTVEDILIVAPYNAQVGAIAERLPPGARVGTVDRFQGQQAPMVIYSMATSSPDDAPRGMPFLYNPNRLNVATSRARCLVILLASEQLFVPVCRTPGEMRLASGLCRYLELSRPIEVA
ncbi:MAG TPA: TM0106 family RecB-like putative nuclease, partial [Gemmatimonadales bacterium]|nr:TM0106 family RecB-like putative nuclease [Gemmatimonadales bacterium]